MRVNFVCEDIELSLSATKKEVVFSSIFPRSWRLVNLGKGVFD